MSKCWANGFINMKNYWRNSASRTTQHVYGIVMRQVSKINSPPPEWLNKLGKCVWRSPLRKRGRNNHLFGSIQCHRDINLRRGHFESKAATSRVALSMPKQYVFLGYPERHRNETFAGALPNAHLRVSIWNTVHTNLASVLIWQRFNDRSSIFNKEEIFSSFVIRRST